MIIVSVFLHPAERTDWLFGVFLEFYMHFAACAAYHTTDNPALQNHYSDMVSGFCEYGLGFRMKMEVFPDGNRSKPTLVWDFSSLKMVLEIVYGFLVSSADQPLWTVQKSV